MTNETGEFDVLGPQSSFLVRLHPVRKLFQG